VILRGWPHDVPQLIIAMVDSMRRRTVSRKCGWEAAACRADRRHGNVTDRTHLTQLEEKVNPPLAAWHVGFVRSIMHGRDGVTADFLREEVRCSWHLCADAAR
jgi:hypothetical protein